MNTTQEQIVNQASDFVIDEIKDSLIKRAAKYTWKLTKNLSKLVWNIVKIIVPPVYDFLWSAIGSAANEPKKKSEKTFADRYTEPSIVGDMVRQDFRNSNP